MDYRWVGCCALLLGCGAEATNNKSEQSSAAADNAATVTSSSSLALAASSAGGPDAPSAGTAAGSGAASSAPEAKKEDLNVLVISVDSLRADRMAHSGYSAEVLPTLNKFASESANYTRFHALSSFTSQTLGGFLGCRYPSEMKRNGTFFGVYPPEETMFPELLQQAGVRTMTAHAHFYFAKGKAGFDQGFDQYELVPGLKKSNTTDQNVSSPVHTELALAQLSDERLSKGRFFAWYHLMDAHDEYLTHPEGKDFGKGAKSKYDGELYFVDLHIKKILDLVESKEWGKRTVVVVTADHGEAFGEHRQYRHGFELWSTLTHVPLMVRGPGIKAREISTPRGMIDLCPTILETFSVSPMAGAQGTSLWPELRGADGGERDVVSDLSRTGDNDRRRALVRGDFKLIELGNADGFQLFDRKADPAEVTDLSRKSPEKLKEMKSALDAAADSIREICPSRTEKLKNKHKGKPC